MSFDEIPEKIKVGNRNVNLREEDMPRAATFLSPLCPNRGLWLKPKDESFNPATKQMESVENTSIRLYFEGYRKEIKNKKLLKMVMESKFYKNGDIIIDAEDPTGFWRQVGGLEVVEKPVIIKANLKVPGVGDIDFAKVTKPEKDEKVERLRVIGV